MWIVCLICTQLGVFSDSDTSLSFRARTDVRNKVIQATPWILIPYPGRLNDTIHTYNIFYIQVSLVIRDTHMIQYQFKFSDTIQT